MMFRYGDIVDTSRVKNIPFDSCEVQSCNCIGPQNGQPLCPCQMRDVEVRNGRYVKVTDLGPVPGDPDQARLDWYFD